MQTNETIQQILASYHEVLQSPVNWGEIDAFGHLNNIYFFRYFENCRIGIYERLGFISQGMLKGVGPIVAESKCRYKAPVTYPDTLHVGAKIVEIGEDRFKIEHIIVSEKLARTAAVGETVIVSYDYEKRRKTPMPQVWRDKLTAMMNPG